MRDPTRLGIFGALPRPANVLAWSRLVLLVVLALLTAGAWVLTVYQARMMDMPMGVVVFGGAEAGMDGMGQMKLSGMAAAGWSLAGAASFLAIWAVMMSAMMLPAAAPMVLVFDTIQAKRRGQPTFVPTWIFVAGYLRLDGNWPGGLRPRPARQRPGFAAGDRGARHVGAARAGGHPRGGGTLPADAPQARLPQPLPLAAGVRVGILARRCRRRATDGLHHGAYCLAAAGHSLRCWWRWGS